MNKLGWQTKLLGLITLVLSTLLLFQLLYVIPYIKNRDMETAQIHQEEIARNIARELEIDLLRITERLERIAERPEFRNMDIDGQKATMIQHEDISELLHSISVMDSEGWFVSSTIDDLFTLTSKSYADRSYFCVPFEQGQPYFAPPRYYATKGLLGASVSVPIELHTGERVGVIMGGVRLNEMIERVANYPLEEGVIAFVVDSEGTLVAHSEIDLFALEEGPLSLDYSDRPLVQAIIAGERDSLGKHKHERVPYFGSYAILEINGWGVIVESPMSVILADSEMLSGWLLAINLALFVIALSIMLIFARQIMAERQRMEEEKRMLEAHLRQQQKLESIGTLASGVAHEINNPITGIMNYAQLIHDRIDPPEERLREFSAGIIEETERVAEIVRNLMTFAHQNPQSRSLASFTEIVEDTLSLIRMAIHREGITLEVDVPDDLPQIKCRSQQIQQVLMNLFTNARDALNQRYPEYDPEKIINVSVQTFEKDGRRWLRTTVEDHGVGIPLEIRERIFEPFYTTKDRALSTGLGLSISLGIVQDHHGELTFESEEGQPTRFHLDLPVDNGWELEVNA